MAAMSKGKAFEGVNDMAKFGGGEFGTFLKGILGDLSHIFEGIRMQASTLFRWKRTSADQVAELQKGMKKLLRSSDEADTALKAFHEIMQGREARPWNPIEPMDYNKASALDRAWGDGRLGGLDAEVLKLIKEVSPMLLPQANLDPVVDGERIPGWQHWIPLSQMHRIREKLADMTD